MLYGTASPETARVVSGRSSAAARSSCAKRSAGRRRSWTTATASGMATIARRVAAVCARTAGGDAAYAYATVATQAAAPTIGPQRTVGSVRASGGVGRAAVMASTGCVPATVRRLAPALRGCMHPKRTGGSSTRTDGRAGLPGLDPRCDSGPRADGPDQRRDGRPGVKRSTIVMLLSAAIAVAACGQSQQDKAKAQVCDARADVGKQVDELRGLTLSTATLDGVSTNLKAIRDDLRKIADAQSNLSGDRRQKVQAANKAFTDQVRSTAQNVGRSLSVADAKTQLQDATTQLASAYKNTLGQIDC